MGWAGCGLTADCARFCNRFEQCLDSTLDEPRCVDACADWADGDEDRIDRVDGCVACIDDRGCLDAVLSCTGACVGIPVR